MRQIGSLATNFGYLGALQSLNLLLPLVTYPYLVRVLGLEVYGSVIFAQAIALYFGVVISYGFNISGTALVAQNKANPARLSTIVSSIYYSKALLFLSSLILFIGLIWVIPVLAKDRLLYVAAFGMCLNELLFPIWYFQGTEKMKNIVLINAAARIAVVIFIFTFVANESHYLRVPLIASAGAIMGGAAGVYMVFFRDRVIFAHASYDEIKALMVDGLPLFYSRLSAAFTERGSVIFIGAQLGMSQVALYDFAMKLVAVFRIPVDVLIQTSFPRIAGNQDKLLAKRQLKLSLIYAIIGGATLATFGDAIARLVGGDLLAENDTYLRYTIPLLIVYCVSYSLGQPYLVAFGHTKAFARLIVLANLIFIVGILALAVAKRISIPNCLILLTVSEGINLILRLYLAKRNKLFAA